MTMSSRHAARQSPTIEISASGDAGPTSARSTRTADRFHRGTGRWFVLVVVSAAALLMLVPFVADAAQRVQVAGRLLDERPAELADRVLHQGPGRPTGTR